VISRKLIIFPLISQIRADLKISLMLPEAFRKRIQLQPYIDSEALFKSINEPSPVSVRVNDVKWAHSPLHTIPVPWCRSGYYLNERPSYTLDPLFHAGCYYPQEASSMFLEEAFLQIAGTDSNNIKVLDLCGAPGGKSTHLSSLIGSNGLLVANEVIRQRAMVLKENLTKWGRSNYIVTQTDPSAFSRLPGFFDMILIDAPCSGEGMFRDPVAISEWSQENASLCSERQKRILLDAWPSLKEDGILIYSTCTFNPNENERNIRWLAGRKEAEPIRLDISGYKGITEIDHEGIYGYGFYPGMICGEGLFISAVRKKEKCIRSSARRKIDSEQKITWEEKMVAGEWTDLPVESFLRLGDDIVAIPCSSADLQSLSATLKIISAGTRILTVRKKNFLPNHELAISVNFKGSGFPATELGLGEALSYLRRDNFAMKFVDKGWNIVTYKGINLGFVNNIGSRFNNYYPVEWRIRMNIPINSHENIITWD
jgi:16S rRNA C967 or C1407 C5-methylase (RsmB/RsmF family)/NOL1/NOP2/fmu family ribosome biogenesis protein